MGETIKKTKMNRRDFLAHSACALAFYSVAGNLFSACASIPARSGKKLFAPPAQQNLFSLSTYVSEAKASYCNYVNSNYVVKSFPVPLETPHSALVLSENRVLLLEQNGGRAVIASFAQNEPKIELIFDLPADEYFYGHGAIAGDGEYLLSSEINSRYAKEVGWIKIRSTKNLQELGRISSYGINPHDINLIEGGRVCVVANHGLTTSDEWRDVYSNVSYIDWNAGRLLRQVPVLGKNVFASHLAANARGDIVVSTRKSISKRDANSHSIRALLENKATRAEGVRKAATSNYFANTAPLFIAANSSKAVELALQQAPMDYRHSLSVCFDLSGQLFALTHIESNLVSIFESATLNCVRQLRFTDEQPYGIAPGPNGQDFWISTNRGRLYKLADLKQAPEYITKLYSGLHLAAAY